MFQVDALCQIVAQHDHHAGQRNLQHDAQQLRPFRQVLQCADGRHACHELHHEKLVVAVQGERREYCGAHHGHEGRAGVHEDADEDGHHGIGHHVDVEELVVHHQVSDDGEDGDERCEQQNAVG